MNSSKEQVKSLLTALWVAVVPTAPGGVFHRPAKLATPGGRRRLLRLQFRINEVLTRVDELYRELRHTKDPHRVARLNSMIAHQETRAGAFLRRFERMTHSPVVHAHAKAA